MHIWDCEDTLDEMRADPKPPAWRRWAWVALGLAILRFELIHPRFYVFAMGFLSTVPGNQAGWQRFMHAVDQDPRARAMLGLMATKLLLFLGLHTWGWFWAKRANAAGDGRDFFYRYVTIACPLGMLILVVSLVLYPVGFLPMVRIIMENVDSLPDPSNETYLPWIDLLVLFLMELYFVKRLVHYITRLANPADEPETNPA